MANVPCFNCEKPTDSIYGVCSKCRKKIERNDPANSGDSFEKLQEARYL